MFLTCDIVSTLLKRGLSLILSVQDVKDALELEGDKSSSVVIIHIRGSNTDEYAIIAVNRNNRVSFIDPQAQRIVDL